MSEIVMDIQDILKLLPHRPPFLLVDRVVEFEPRQRIVGIKSVTMNEPFFTGHFPGRPIMPGVLIVEAMAQTSALLALKSTENDPKERGMLYLFAGIDNARFKRIVVPGDQLRMEIETIKIRNVMWKVNATATVDGEIACQAELMSMKIPMNAEDQKMKEGAR